MRTEYAVMASKELDTKLIVFRFHGELYVAKAFKKLTTLAAAVDNGFVTMSDVARNELLLIESNRPHEFLEFDA